MLNCDYDSKACHVQFFIKIKFLTTSKPASNNICLLFPSYNPSVSLYFFCEFFFFIFSTSFMLVNFSWTLNCLSFFILTLLACEVVSEPETLGSLFHTRHYDVLSVSLFVKPSLTLYVFINLLFCLHQSIYLIHLFFSIFADWDYLLNSVLLSLFPHKTFVSLYSSIFLFLLINPQSLFLFLLYPSFCYFSISISISPLFILYLITFLFLLYLLPFYFSSI